MTEPRTDFTEQRCAELVDEIPGAVLWEADAWAVQLSFVSGSAAELLGFPAEQWQSEQAFLMRHVHPDDACGLQDAMYRAAAEGDAHVCQHRMICADGSSLWTQTWVQRSGRSNGALILSGMTVDIHRSKEAEVALHEAERRSRLLIENLRDHVVFMVALDGTVATWSSGGERLKGYPRSDFLGKPISRFFPDDEVERGTPERLLKRAALDGTGEYEGWLVRQNGTRFWAKLGLSALRDETGQLFGFSNVATDMTERRQTENALRESEEHFRLLVGSVLDYGVFTISVEGNVSSWNEGAQRLKGYRAHEIVGSPLSTFFPEEEKQKGTPERLIEEAALRGSSSYEGQLVRKGGGHFWSNVTLSAIEDESGRLRGFSNVARDVTPGKITEDALRESQERLALLIDSLQDYGVFMLSAEGDVASWSSGAERLKGYREKEIMGAPITRFFPSEEVDRGTPQDLVERAAREERAEYEGWLIRKDGRCFWASLILSAIRDSEGRLRGLSNVVRDLTERMRAERASSLLSDLGMAIDGSLDFRAILEKVAELATRDLADGCLIGVLANDAIEPAAVAHADPEVRRRIAATSHSVPLEPRLPHGFARVVRSGQPELKPEVRDAGSLGEALGLEETSSIEGLDIASYMCVPLTAGGSTFGAMAFMAKTAQRYTAEDLQLAEELARRVALAVDNARLYEKAQDAVRLREDVLAVVSHDLRSPLTTISMAAAQLVAAARRGEGPEKTSEVAERIKRTSERMAHMIEDLLDFSGIAAGKLSVHLADHDAEGLLEEAYDAARPIAAERGIRIERESHAAGVHVRCDRGRVQQVFANLIGNAVKFMEGEGLIVVGARVERRHVTFSVSDTGPGIPEDELRQVFNRYRQGRGASREGLGLGLAISEAIVHSHGGHIWIESEPGQGTTVFFTVPRAPDHPEG